MADVAEQQPVAAEGAPLVLDLPPGVARYRVLLLGHTDDGRLGLFEDRLNVAPQNR